MITRIWHGYTTPERADEYEALLKAEVIKGIEGKNIPGFRGIDVLRRPLGDEVEFITVMAFDSIDSVKAFVGDDYEQAYVPDEARAILSRFDERSQHYEVRDSRAYDSAEDSADRSFLAAFQQDEAAVGQADSIAAPSDPAPQPAAAQPAGAVLPPDIWFVRKNRGNGSVPVSREGYKVAAKFVFGMLGWAVVAVAMVVVGIFWGPPWLTLAALPFFVLGTFLSAWYFIAMARKHTDASITYNDYLKARRNA